MSGSIGVGERERCGQCDANRVVSSVLDPGRESGWHLDRHRRHDRCHAARHTATLLLNGMVLVTGGDGPQPDSPLTATELYDPSTGNVDS